MKDIEFEAKSSALNELLKNTCEDYLFVNKGENVTSLGMKGNSADIVFMMRKAYMGIREEFAKRYGEEMADTFLKPITMTEEELDAENARLEKEVQKAKKGIPSWLKKLMELKEEEDDENTIPYGDSDDDTEEDDEEDEDGDDDGSDSDRHGGVNIHIHIGDDGTGEA